MVKIAFNRAASVGATFFTVPFKIDRKSNVVIDQIGVKVVKDKKSLSKSPARINEKSPAKFETENLLNVNNKK